MTEAATARAHGISWRTYLLRLLVGCALLAFLAHRADLGEVATHLSGVAIAPLLATIPLYVAILLLHTWRWRVVLISKAIELEFTTCLQLLVAGNFLNLFLPGNLGGDVYRVLGARNASSSLLQSTGIVVIERYCGFLATFLLALGGIATTDFATREPRLTALVLSLFVFFLLPVLLAITPTLTRPIVAVLETLGLSRLASGVDRVVGAVRVFFSSTRLVVHVILLSLGMKLCVTAILWLLGAALDLEIRWHELLVFLPIHTVVSALPISLNGLGVREANLVAFFVVMGLTEPQSASLALLHLIWLYGTAVPGGLLLLRRRRL